MKPLSPGALAYYRDRVKALSADVDLLDEHLEDADASLLELKRLAQPATVAHIPGNTLCGPASVVEGALRAVTRDDSRPDPS